MASYKLRKVVDLPTASSFYSIAWFNGALYVGGTSCEKNGALFKVAQVKGSYEVEQVQIEGIAATDPIITKLIVANDQNKGPALVAGFQSKGSSQNLAWFRNGQWHFSAIHGTDKIRTPSIEDLAVQPVPEGRDVLYISFYCSSIARTEDFGDTFELVSGTGVPMMIYRQVISADASHLWIGREAPLDFAWAAWADIGKRMSTSLPYKFHKTTGGLEWGNRRPNSIYPSPFNNGIMYFGLEGAVAKIAVDKDQRVSGEWIASWEHSDNEKGYGYPYILGLGVNPRNAREIVCGGFDKANPEKIPTLLEVADGASRVIPLPEFEGGANHQIACSCYVHDLSEFMFLVSPMSGSTGPTSIYGVSWDS